MAESLPNFTSVDPYTQVYDALWAALFSVSADFAALVDAENRTDLSTASPEIPANAECRNLPNVILGQADWSASPGNSKAKETTQAYPLRIATSNWSVATLNRLKWEAWRALEIADATDPNFGLSFVRGWVIRTAGDSAASSNENRGEEKWTTVANIVVTMCIPRQSLTS
jgi:hypothetical protein